MRPPHRTLNRQQAHRSAARFLRDHLPLRPYKRSVTIEMLWAVLLVTAAEVGSLHATGQWLDGLPAEETVRQALYASLPGYAELQRRLNVALAGRLPRPRRRRQRRALDLTSVPYHGEPFHDRAEVDRSKAVRGTSHFHAYAAAYVVHRGSGSRSRCRRCRGARRWPRWSRGCWGRPAPSGFGPRWCCWTGGSTRST